MSDIAKINLKIGQIEISIEGPSDFVSNQYDKVEAHLKTYSDISVKLPVDKPDNKNDNNDDSAEASSKGGGDAATESSDSFGEWLSKIPKGTNDTSKAILAGYYTQVTSAAKNFRVRDVTKILKDHGIKLSNPSSLLKNAVDSKKIFQVSKTGTEAHYKLQREAQDEMNQLLGNK